VFPHSQHTRRSFRRRSGGLDGVAAGPLEIYRSLAGGPAAVFVASSIRASFCASFNSVLLSMSCRHPPGTLGDGTAATKHAAYSLLLAMETNRIPAQRPRAERDRDMIGKRQTEGMPAPSGPHGTGGRGRGES
jgi:hypothetical protein